MGTQRRDDALSDLNWLPRLTLIQSELIALKKQ